MLGADEERSSMRNDNLFWKERFIQAESSANSAFDFSVYH